MSKASDKEMAELHGTVAKVINAQLSQNSDAQWLLSQYRTELPKDVVQFLENVSVASPAIIQAATKFLKDNSITCDPSTDTNVQSLQEKLKARKSVSNLSLVVDN